MRPARLLTYLAATAVAALMAGCGLIPTASTAPAPASAASPAPTDTPSSSVTESPSSAPTETPGTTDLVVSSDRWFPTLVAPSLSTLWSTYKDKHTHIQFKMPSKPKSHTYKNSQGYGDQIIDWTYTTSYQLNPADDPVFMVVDAYRVTGALYASGSQFVQKTVSLMRSHGYQRLRVSGAHWGTVKGHKAYFATIAGYYPKDKKWSYARVAVVSGSGWGLYLRTDVWVSKVTQGDKSDAQKLLGAMIEGLRLPKGGA